MDWLRKWSLRKIFWEFILVKWAFSRKTRHYDGEWILKRIHEWQKNSLFSCLELKAAREQHREKSLSLIKDYISTSADPSFCQPEKRERQRTSLRTASQERETIGIMGASVKEPDFTYGISGAYARNSIIFLSAVSLQGKLEISVTGAVTQWMIFLSFCSLGKVKATAFH